MKHRGMSTVHGPSQPEIVTLGSPESALGFTRTGGGGWTEWDRFLTLDGKPAYHLGNICNTCEFFFERLDGATHSVTAECLAGDLAAGVPSMEAAWLQSVGRLLPVGEYVPFYTQAALRLVTPGKAGDYYAEEQIATWGVDAFWGLPHDPRTEYYRGRVVPLPPATFGNRAVFEFVVPMFPHGWLDADRVAEYRAHTSPEPPTALTLSVLDVKGPAMWDEPPAVAEHWCLAHYLLDGHHKVYAAASAGAPVGLLSFLAVGQSIAAPDDVLEVVRQLTARAAP
jgi:hypothetical protein